MSTERKSIIDDLKKLFDSLENVKIITSDENCDNRIENMIIVACESTEQINYQLPDYAHHCSITLDTFIADDPNTTLFNTTLTSIRDILRPVLDNTIPYSEIFSAKVVGIINPTLKYYKDDSSNGAVFEFDVITCNITN